MEPYRGRTPSPAGCALVVTASLNGKEIEYTIGSRQQPLRWITPAEGEGEPSTPTVYGWDMNRQRWVKGFQPF